MPSQAFKIAALQAEQIALQRVVNIPDHWSASAEYTVDWHVYESDGHLCLCTTAEEFIKSANGIALDEFIRKELRPYLFNQTYRRKEGFFLNEMPHGDAGQLSSLKSLLKTNDIRKIRQFLLRANAHFTRGRTDFCFCESGLKYRHCHRDILNTFKSLGKMKLAILLSLVEGSKEYRYSHYGIEAL